MTTLTVNLHDNLKSSAQKKAKEDGVTLTFVIIQALKAYKEGKIQFGVINSDEEITASFDVSTLAGKKAAIESFKNIGK